MDVQLAAAGPSRRHALIAVGAVLLARPAAAMQVQAEYLFGSPVELIIPTHVPSSRAQATLRRLRTIHREWNAWKPGRLFEVNRALAAGRTVDLPPDLRALLLGAAALERASGGLFNPAIGRLVGDWGFHADRLRDGPPPDPKRLDAWAARPPRMASLELRGGSLRSRDARVQLDFGAYAKGVALDEALDHLRFDGVGSALLNLGGNVAAMGARDGRPWLIGIRDPFGPGLVAALPVDGREAVITSGRYERARHFGAQRFAHVIDPFLARPVEGLQSVTVVHAEAARADAAATALLVAGPQRWPRVAQAMGVTQVLVIDDQGRRRATPPLRQRLIAPRHI